MISSNLGELKNIAINIPTAISDDGIILRQPPNLKIENIIGDNLLEIISSKFQDCKITIQNDTQSCLAIELTKTRPDVNVYADINGTGTNCAIYTKSHNLQNLEYGQIMLEDFHSKLENFTGGKSGIKDTFNSLYSNHSKQNKKYSNY